VFERLLEKLVAALNTSGIPYMVIGGQAVLLYGEPRLTKDIDITLGIDPSQGMRLLDMLGRLDMKVLVDDPCDFLRKTFVLPALDKESGIRVDFIFSLSEYELAAIDRAPLVQIGESQIRFVTVEDLIIHKIIAGRQRDLEDVKAVLIKNPKFDRDYVYGWIRDFDASLSVDFELRLNLIVQQLTKSGLLAK
jgi:hypothetical protein